MVQIYDGGFGNPHKASRQAFFQLIQLVLREVQPGSRMCLDMLPFSFKKQDFIQRYKVAGTRILQGNAALFRFRLRDVLLQLQDMLFHSPAPDDHLILGERRIDFNFYLHGFPLCGMPLSFAVDNSDYTDALPGVNRPEARGGNRGIRGKKTGLKKEFRRGLVQNDMIRIIRGHNGKSRLSQYQKRDDEM